MGFVRRQTRPDENGRGYVMSESFSSGGEQVRITISSVSKSGTRGLYSWTDPNEHTWVEINAIWDRLTEGEMIEPTNKTILEEARELVYGDRNKQYGHPKDDYAKVATMWSAFLGVDISPHQAAAMMIFIKMSRLAHEPKRDTIVDIAGYAEVVARILDMDE